MQVGCGFRVHTIKGREYVYFWHYEDHGGRSRQVHEYVGPRRSTATLRRLLELLDAYYARAGEALHRERASARILAAGLR